MRNFQNQINYTRHLVLFGLGAQFQDCYRQLVLCLGREPDLLCDNAPEKWGKKLFGKQCISPGDLSKLGENTSVVITIRRYEDIYRQLCDLGLKNIFIACFDRGYEIVHSVKGPAIEYLVDHESSFESPVRNKWTLVTGASRGIGRQIALEMARLGSNIIGHSRKISHARKIADPCSALGVQFKAIAADFTNLAEIEEMLDNLEHNYPPIDIVFNNAGISLACGPDPWNISSQDYLIHYTVNTIAPIRICYRLIPSMIRRGFGRVVNISSTIQRRPLEAAYACSKSALNKFVHDLAPSIEGTNVAICLVCPGYVRSDMGGSSAPHPVESIIPGALLGTLLDGDVNARWFFAQDYAGLSLSAAMEKAKFYRSHED